MGTATLIRAAVRTVRRGRVAPATRRLFVDVARLQLSSWTQSILARVRPVRDAHAWWVRRPVAVHEGRRVLVQRRLSSSIADRTAEAVSAWSVALAAVGVHSQDEQTAAGPELTVAAGEPGEAALRSAAERLESAWHVEVAAERQGQGSATVERYDQFAAGDPVRVVSLPVRAAADRSVDRPAPIPPIDIVVTWVDSTDPAWSEAFARFAHHADGIAAHPSRFAHQGELRFALRSIWLYAGWFRQVVLVTSGERPSWIRADHRLRVVRHDEFMPPSALPTFNSHAIESRLHHIPGLAERFVYCNDDFFVGRPVSPTTFFDDSSDRQRIFPVDGILPDLQHGESGQVAATHRTIEIIAAHTDADPGRVGLLAHAPYANTVSNLQAVERVLAADFDRTAHARFRTPADVSVAASLGPWWSWATGRAEIAHPAIEYVSLGHPMTRLRLRRNALAPATFWCANRTERSAVTAHAHLLDRSLRRMLPEPCPWEIS